MFSHNGKISEKQMRRMLVLSTFASSIFVLPYLSAKLYGESVCSGLLVFLLFAAIYVGCIYRLGAWYQKKWEKAEKGDNCTAENPGMAGVFESSGIGGKALALIQLFRMLVRLVFYIVLSIKILGEAQVPFMQEGDSGNAMNLLVVLPLLLVALYGAAQGNGMDGTAVEKQGRLHEMIFWVMFVPFIIMILFGLKEVDYTVFVPHFTMPAWTLLLYSYALLTFILPVENYLYLRPALQEHRLVEEKNSDSDEGSGKLKKRKTHVWISYTAIWFVIVLAVVLSLFMLGIYGVRGAGNEEMVTIAIMRYIRLPLGVLERFDVLMVWFFMTGCFLLICSTLFYAGSLFRILCSRIKRIWLLLTVLVLAVIDVVLLPEYGQTLFLFLCYGAILDIPLSLLVPLLGMGLSEKHLPEKKKGRKLKLLPLLCLLLLTGCSPDNSKSNNDMKNVEQRGYATILLVSEGEEGKLYHFDLGIAKERRTGEDSQTEEVCSFDCNSFAELSEAYQMVKGKDLSLAHLKVILIENPEIVVNGKGDSGKLLYDMDANEEIAKTCSVLQLSDKKKFLDYLKDAKEPVGSYLGGLIEVAEHQGKDVPWLKDYLKTVREGTGLLIYELEQVSEGWTLKCNAEIKGNMEI